MKKYRVILVMTFGSILLAKEANAQSNSPNGNYTTSNNNLSLYTSSAAGTLRMRILTSNGFVGIGNVPSPTEMLQVNGNILTSGNGNITAAGWLHSDAGVLNVSSAINPFILTVNLSEKMRILASGHVGIGISPTERLHVNGGNILTSGNLITTAGILNVNSASNPFILQVNASEKMRILSTGSVGIGTTPTEMLHVNGGNILTSGNLITTAGVLNVNNASNPFILQVNASEKMRILTSGNVGIGITPTEKLHVNGGNILTTGNLITTAGILNVNNASNPLVFQSNSVEKMRILSSGNVGIGSSSPSERLHITGTTRSDAFNSVNGAFSTIGATDLNLSTGSLVADGTGGNVRVTISNSTGFMGIGNASPGDRLHVNGNTHTSNNFITDNGILNVNSASSPLVFQANSVPRLTILNAGNVGIGTSTPGYLLDVAGTINATNILINGSPIPTSTAPAGVGATKEIPFTNPTASTLAYSSSFTYDGVNSVLRVGQINPTINGTPNNTYIFGEEAVINGSPSGGGHVTDAIIGGQGNTVGDGINFYSGSGGISYGGWNFNYGISALVGGTNARTLQGGQGGGSLWAMGAVAIGLTEYSNTLSSEPVTANAGAVNISTNTTAQTAGHGAYGNLSVILGGRNHNIPQTSPRSVVLGGDAIKARPNDPDQVYVTNFNIANTPPNDNTLTQLLVRDGVTGQIKYRDVTAVGAQWAVSGNNISFSTGNVGIGTSLTSNPNNYKLAVNGKVGAKDFQVENNSATWPDYVFGKGYSLASLQEVEYFIKEQGHLKEVPSAQEIDRKGHSLGEMDKILLRKIEELTLYVIQQQKEIDELRNRIGK